MRPLRSRAPLCRGEGFGFGLECAGGESRGGLELRSEGDMADIGRRFDEEGGGVWVRMRGTSLSALELGRGLGLLERFQPVLL